MTYATDRLIKNARTSLPGSLDNVIQLELFNVIDQFLRDTSLWTEDVPFTVSISEPAGTIYYIEPESVSTIVRLLGCWTDSKLPQKATMETPGELIFPYAPVYDGIHMASVALSIIDPMQGDGYPEFPEWILQMHHVGILDGLLGRMMAQPAKPYTNANLAAAHLKMFRQATSIAATQALHKNVHNAQAWMFPQQFATRSRRR